MTWKKTDIGSPIPDTIASVAKSASAVIGSVQPVLQTASSLVDVASALYSSSRACRIWRCCT